MNGFTVTRYGHSRFWAVHDPAGDLVCLCVYKRGALEVARRLAGIGTEDTGPCLREEPPREPPETGASAAGRPPHG